MNSNCQTLFSSPLLDAIKDLSNVTLRAIQITFFPDVMITDRHSDGDSDSGTDANVGVDKKNKCLNNQGEKEKSNECDEEYEMMKVMIRDQCAVSNIFPVLFNLLRHVSTMTLVISIIVHLPSCHCEYPTKEVLLANACIEVLTPREGGGNRSAPVSNKRQKTSGKDEQTESDNILTSMNKFATDGIVDSNFTLTLSKFLHLATQDAKQVIGTEKYSKQMNNEIKFNHVKVGNIIGAIRLIHAFVGLDSCLEENTVSLQNKDIVTILSTLYEAGLIISDYIYTSTQSDCLSDTLSHHVASLLDLCLGVLAYQDSPTSFRSEHSEISIAQTRKNLISSLVQSAILHWSKMSKQSKSQKSFSTENQAHDIKQFDRAVLTFLDDTYLDHLQELFKKSQFNCHETISSVESHLGMSHKMKRICHWKLLSSLSHNKIFKNYCIGLLVEERYSLEQR